MAKAKFALADDLFRQLLKEIRLAKGLTQIDLSTRLGQPQSYVSKYETGERRLDFVETVSLCRALGVEIEDFAATFSAGLHKASGEGH